MKKLPRCAEESRMAWNLSNLKIYFKSFLISNLWWCQNKLKNTSTKHGIVQWLLGKSYRLIMYTKVVQFKCFRWYQQWSAVRMKRNNKNVSSFFLQIKKKHLWPLFIVRFQLSECCRATMRRQFTFNHQVFKKEFIICFCEIDCCIDLKVIGYANNISNWLLLVKKKNNWKQRNFHSIWVLFLITLSIIYYSWAFGFYEASHWFLQLDWGNLEINSDGYSKFNMC